MTKLNLSVGDPVIVYPGSAFQRKYLSKIKSITPKGAYRTEHNYLYDEYGNQKGGDVWSRSKIMKYEGQEKETFDLEKRKISCLSVIEKTSFEKLPLDSLEKIAEILKAAE
ncbi:hypothetical protein M2146_001146 [Lachnospiraceae bacterium PF1-22]